MSLGRGLGLRFTPVQFRGKQKDAKTDNHSDKTMFETCSIALFECSLSSFSLTAVGLSQDSDANDLLHTLYSDETIRPNGAKKKRAQRHGSLKG